jgi:hypothetical protein
VNDWTPLFLGVIAVAVLVMAAIQVGAVVYGARLARRVSRLTDQVEREIQPLFAHLQTVGAEAARTSALATRQVERADVLLADASERLRDTLAIVQTAIVTPARDWLAIVAGFRAALGILRGEDEPPRRGGAGRSDDEESLFIG